MKNTLHSWDITPKEAIALQKKLAGLVQTRNSFEPVRTVGGLDVGFSGADARAAIAVLDVSSLALIDSAVANVNVSFPYIPGLLSFREGPAVIAALEAVTIKPDLLILDGQGLAHPRRFGLACHIGVVTGMPTIGCAKSRLCGTYREPGWNRGSHTALNDHDEVIGAVVRTRSGVNPVYVSVGHRIDLQTSISWVLLCCTRYRLPETTRWAHRLAGSR